MNSKTKRRMGVVTGLIVIVLIVVLAVVGGNSAARTVSIAEALEINNDAKIQVTGNVVENSFSINDDVLTFQIYDNQEDADAKKPLDVRYEGGVAATFGNDVTAICTGKMSSEGYLNCSELVTKCPSKYENAEGALGVEELLTYGDAVLNKPVKVFGVVKPGTIAGVDAEDRFILLDSGSAYELHVKFAGALPDGFDEGSKAVLTGSINADGLFVATNVALEG